MKVAVVTPYADEPLDWLRQAHESVRAQGHPVTHVMVADGVPRPELDAWPVVHIGLAHRARDWGNTPRRVGVGWAEAEGFQAVCLLDADNWYRPDHVGRLVEATRRSGMLLATSRRSIHAIDGRPIGRAIDDDPATPPAPGLHVAPIVRPDLNTILWTQPTYSIWQATDACPPQFAYLLDMLMWRVIWMLAIAWVRVREDTVAYRATTEGWYQRFGEAPPEGLHKDIDPDGAVAAFNRLSPDDRRVILGAMLAETQRPGLLLPPGLEFSVRR